jgi:hypothetical protein
VYTVFLAIALVAILVAILFLCLEMSPYEFKFKGGPPVVRIGAPGMSGGVRMCRVLETRPGAALAVRYARVARIFNS